jgi:hypothetical protein
MILSSFDMPEIGFELLVGGGFYLQNTFCDSNASITNDWDLSRKSNKPPSFCLESNRVMGKNCSGFSTED